MKLSAALSRVRPGYGKRTAAIAHRTPVQVPSRPHAPTCGLGPCYSLPPDTEAQVKAVTAEEDPSPFFEPLVRCFLLGVGSGAIFESAHVLFKFAGIASTLGTEQIIAALPEMSISFSPLIVWDHVAAVGSWLLLYIIEAIAIISVLQRYPDDTETATKTIRNMPTLPKKMLPVKLTSLKNILYGLVARRLWTSFAFRQAAAVPTGPVANAAPLAAAATVVTPRPPEQLLKPESDQVASDTPTIVWPRKAKPGAWDPAKSAFARRQKELLERSSFLRDFWYAAALSENVKDKPLGVKILGMKLVLFRDADGQVHCLDDTCVHRGAPLSGGWVADVSGHTCVVCPYHGWAFDTKGRLQDVPSVENAGAWPKRALVRPFPVVEKGGFIWLFYGNPSMPMEERPPIPFAPEFDDPNWKAVYGEIEFDCGHWSVFENAIDMAHIHYLHGDTFGNQDEPKIHDMQVSRDTWSIQANFQINNKPVSPLWEWTAVNSVPVEAKAILPSSSCITIQLGAGVSMITFVNTVPISANKCVNRFALIRNFAGWNGFDEWARRAMYRILGEDKVMVETLNPERLLKEISVGPDLPQVAFRKLRQEWIDLGYGVSPAEAEQDLNVDF